MRSIRSSGSRAFITKLGVVVTCTLLWLTTVVVRGPFGVGKTDLDASWLIGLAASFQQGHISGRDFHFSFGPAAQVLAWLATSLTTTKSAFDGYCMMGVFFCGLGPLVVAAVLLLYDRVSWKHTAVVYSCAALLNMLVEISSFRAVLPLLMSALAYRAVAAATVRRQVAWMAVTGFVCFISQLVSPVIGVFGAAIVLGTLVVNHVINKGTASIRIAGVFLAIVVLLNLLTGFLFKLSSPHYGAILDYQKYALETIRGYNNTMGSDWGLRRGRTIFLVLLTLYTVVTAIVGGYRSSRSDRCLLAGLMLASLISLKSAFVRSDIGHITFGFVPLVFTFLLLGKKDWNPALGRIVWCGFAVGLFFVWPWTGWSAIRDCLKVIDGELPVPLALRQMSSTSIAPETVLPPTLLAPELRGRATPMLPFPYENYIPVVLKRPLLAPVLQSYSASTEALQRFYVDTIARQRSDGLDVVYSLDTVAAWPVDEVQTITRVPLVFEYLYRHFELSSTEENQDGRYVLEARSRPRDLVFQELPFTENRSDDGSATIRLTRPTACNLIQLEMKTTYSPARLLLRPGGVALKFSRGSDLVFTGYVRSLELNREFITYISLVKPAMFHRVFGSSLIPGKVWDAVTLRPLKTDVLGTSPLKIDVNHIRCVSPEMFAEGDVPEVQTLFTTDILKGPTETGYVLLTAQSESMPELRVRLGFSRGIQTYADVQATPMASSYSMKLNSVSANDVGLALVNPGKTPIRIEIAYRGDESMRSVALILNGAQQSSKFLSELLSMGAMLSGTLEISSESKFAIFAAQFVGERFRPLRVDRNLPTTASNERFILFPQFAIHGGWATALIVSNLNSATATGQIQIFSSSGDPLPVTLNGVTSSTFSYSVRPGSLYTLSPGVSSPGSSK